MYENNNIINEIHEDLFKETEESYDIIMNILKKHHPLELIEYLSIISYFFNNIKNNNILTAAQIEFICGIILSIQYDEESNYDEISPEVIQILLDNLVKFFFGFGFTNFSRKMLNINDDEEKEKQFLIASLANEFGIVRGDAQAFQLKEQALDLFKEFDEWMIKYEGFTVSDAIKFIDLIFKRYGKLLFNYINKLLKKSEEFAEIIYEEVSKLNIKNLKNVRKFIKNYRTNKGKKDLIQFITIKFFEKSHKGMLIFDIDEIIEEEKIQEKERFIKFINRFCSPLNQTGNKKFKYPTDDNVFRQRPIISFENKYIVPNPTYLIWVLQSEIEKDMKSTSIWESYQKRKGQYLEKEVLKVFDKILPGCNKYCSLYYYVEDKDGNKNRCELDALIIYDSNIFLIESKSGIFKTPARRGAIKTLSSVIYENIEYAFEQAYRAREYIKSNEKVVFYNEDDSIKTIIDNKKYSNIFLLNVTLENFGEIATRIHRFKNIGLYKQNEFPWSVNINDLKTIAEFIEFPSQFIHYIHRRLKINNRSECLSDIFTNDELDFLGTYFDNNLYFDEEKEYNFIVLNDYSLYFNEYYLRKEAGEPIDRLSQKMNPKFKRIIMDLEKLHQHGHTDVIVKLLDLSNDTRNEIVDCIDSIVSKTIKDGEFHDATLVILSNPQNNKSGFGITMMSGLSKNREEMLQRLEGYSKIKKYQQKAFEWLAIGKYADDKSWAINECIYLKYEEEYSEELEQAVKKLFTKPMTWTTKVGRNDPCPCGSGKKFKKCHGQ